jgi:hypothetical protein
LIFFQQFVGLVQIFNVGSPLRDLNPFSSPRIETLMIFPASNASAALPPPPLCCQRRRQIAHRPRAAAALPPPLCQRCHRASDAAAPLPPMLLCCRRCHRSITAVAVVLSPCFPTAHHRAVAALPLLPSHCQHLRRAACCCRAAATLPPPLCQHCHCTPAANTALQMPLLVQHDLFHRLCCLVPSPFQL